MNLYRVNTRNFTAYCLGNNMDEASEKFTRWLNENDYGVYDSRVVISCELIAKSDIHTVSDSNYKALFL